MIKGPVWPQPESVIFSVSSTQHLQFCVLLKNLAVFSLIVTHVGCIPTVRHQTRSPHRVTIWNEISVGSVYIRNKLQVFSLQEPVHQRRMMSMSVVWWSPTVCTGWWRTDWCPMNKPGPPSPLSPCWAPLRCDVSFCVVDLFIVWDFVLFLKCVIVLSSS